MTYKYVAYTSDRNIVQGMIDVGTESMAEEALGQAGYRVLSLKKVRPRPRLERLMPTLFGIKAQDVVAFSRQLAMLLATGTSLVTALQLLRDRTSRSAFKRVINDVIGDIEAGGSFAEAVAKHPHAFPQMYGQMIRIGEQTGNLEAVLNQVASYIEKEKAAMKKMRRAMAYPALIVLVAIGVVAILFTVALPPLLGMFAEFDAEVPWSTRLLLGIVNFVTSYKLYLLGGILAIVAFTAWYVRRPAGRRRLDKLRLKLPILGPINVLRSMSHFCRTMSMLLRAGLPLTDIMDVVMQTTKNRIVCEALSNVRQGLIQGQGLSQPMRAIGLFPPLLVQMVMVGEETDTLDSNLATLADTYESEADERTNALTSMMGPFLTIAIAVGVAFIVISVIMPMYSIMGTIE